MVPACCLPGQVRYKPLRAAARRNEDGCDPDKKPPNIALMVRSGRRPRLEPWPRTPSFPPWFKTRRCATLLTMRPSRRHAFALRATAGSSGEDRVRGGSATPAANSEKQKRPLAFARRAQFAIPDFQNIPLIASRQAEGANSSRRHKSSTEFVSDGAVVYHGLRMSRWKQVLRCNFGTAVVGNPFCSSQWRGHCG